MSITNRMKRNLLLAIAALSALASCAQSGQSSAESTPAVDSVSVAVVDTVYYEGVVPAADGPGIRYTIAVAQDSAQTYRVTETYLEAENGKDLTSTYETVAQPKVVVRDGVEVSGLMLTLAPGNELYLLQKGDSALTIVNSELKEADAKLNFTLKRR